MLSISLQNEAVADRFFFSQKVYNIYKKVLTIYRKERIIEA